MQGKFVDSSRGRKMSVAAASLDFLGEFEEDNSRKQIFFETNFIRAKIISIYETRQIYLHVFLTIVWVAHKHTDRVSGESVPRLPFPESIRKACASL
jgi:hypothetical protein